MPSRRPHVKSRHGCVPCKRARVKCDQAHPVCSKCVRFGRPCEYLLQPTASVEQSERPAIPTPQPSTSSVLTQYTPDQHTPLSPPPEITFDDLGLMHLYTSATCMTLDPSPDLREIWRESVPKQAMSAPFLMHSILALAALHQISLGTVHYESNLSLAIKHQSLALTKSKPELNNLSECNCHALFAFSAMIAISALALPVSRPAATLQDPINEFAQTAILMRGSKIIVQEGFPWLEGGPFSPLLRRGFLTNPTGMPKHIAIIFNTLETRIESTKTDERNKASYRSAFKRLNICFHNMHFNQENDISIVPGDRGVVWSWLATVEADFIPLLGEKDPMALVLLAYFAVLLHALDEVWWCRGWGSALIKSVLEEVGESWQPSLRWPAKQIGLETMLGKST